MPEGLNFFGGILLNTSALAAISCAVYYFLRRKGNFRSNIFLGGFLLVFGLALIRNGLVLFNILNPENLYLALLWNTLWLGPLFFFYIKLNIYPHYILRGSDLKHFVLPLAQSITHLIFILIGMSNKNFQENIGPLQYPIEGVLFIITFFPYIILSFRYVKFAGAKKETIPLWKINKLNWFNRIVKVLFVLAFINSSYIILNFLSRFIFSNELSSLPTFFIFSELSFGIVATWISYQASKLIVGKAYKYLPEESSPTFESLVKSELPFLDADLNEKRFVDNASDHQRLVEWISASRAAYLRKLTNHPSYTKHQLKSLIYRSGYPNHWIYTKK